MLKLDHHCHWLGTCLGARNYHVFYWYLFHLVLLCIGQILFAGLYIWRVFELRDIENASEDNDTYIVSLFKLQEVIVLSLTSIYVIAIG